MRLLKKRFVQLVRVDLILLKYVLFVIVLLMLPYKNSLAMEFQPYLTLGYGGEKGQLCPTYVNTEEEKFKTIYVASAQAGLWYNLYASVYFSAGYNYMGCVFNSESESVIQSPYLELRAGTRKFISAAIHNMKNNPFSNENYFYEFRIGRCVSEDCGLSVDVSTMLGKHEDQTKKQVRNYYLMARLNF